MSEFTSRLFLETPGISVRDVCCRGTCRHQGAEEAAHRTQLVFAYRGLFVRHLGSDEAVAEANQVVLFNAGEGYRVSHPVEGGDACLALAVDEALLREVAPAGLLERGARTAFTRHRLRIDARTQALVAFLRHG